MSKGTTMLPATVHHEFKDEAPVLSVRHLAKRFGAGCDYCRAWMLLTSQLQLWYNERPRPREHIAQRYRQRPKSLQK